MVRSRRGLFPSLLALALVVGLSAGALNLEPRVVPVRLPDGSTVTFAGMAYGTGPGITYGRPWQRLLYPIVPPQLRPSLGKEVVQLPPNPWPGSLSLWFQHSGYLPQADRVGARRMLTIDSHGCPFEWGYWEGFREYRGGMMSQSRIRAYSRREPLLEHRYLVRTGATEWMQVLGVPTSSPGLGQYPHWRSQPLPQSRTAGDLSVTLASLRAPAHLPPVRQAVRNDREVMSEVRLRVDGAGGRPGVWQPVEVALEDATGNRHAREPLQVAQLDDHQPAQDWRRGARAGEWRVRLPGGLCSHEAAWKVRVECSRHLSRSESPDEVWQVPGLSVLPGQRYRTFTVGPGIEGIIEANQGVKGKTVVGIGIRFIPVGRRFRVEATDDRGRMLSAVDAGFWDPAILQTRCRDFIFQVSPDTRRLDLRFKVYNTRSFEFLAKPTAFGRMKDEG